MIYFNFKFMLVPLFVPYKICQEYDFWFVLYLFNMWLLWACKIRNSIPSLIYYQIWVWRDMRKYVALKIYFLVNTFSLCIFCYFCGLDSRRSKQKRSTRIISSRSGSFRMTFICECFVHKQVLYVKFVLFFSF